MANRPMWLRTTYRLERLVGEPVEKVLSSRGYYAGVSTARRASRRAVSVVEGISRRGLHLLNLPAGTDIRRVREQLARIDRRLVEIAKEVEDLDRETPLREEPAKGTVSDGRV